MFFSQVVRRPMISRSVNEAIAREEASGLAYVFWSRNAVLLILAIWVSLTLPFERSSLYVSAILAFALVGIVPYAFRHRYTVNTGLVMGFVFLDAAALSFVLIVPTPFDFEGWTQQMNLRTPAFLYIGVFVVSMALSYKPALVIWTGLAAAAFWSMGYLWVATRPNAIPFTSGDVLDEGMGAEMALAKVLDPNAVGLARLSNQVVFLVLISLILTIVVVRSRELVRRQVEAEAQRAILSRYFSPNIVREFAEGRWEPDKPGNRPVAVLFADMVDFTSISERLPPQDLIALLRTFHGRLAKVAFEQDGTIDKFIGDAVMVHFGTPRARPDDPVRALRCATRMAETIRDWNAEREMAGEPPVGVGIGLHYGPAVVGNIGDEHKLEYTVLGDTVNVASRLEKLTRKIGTEVVVSNELVEAVKASSADPVDVVPGLYRAGQFEIRGRREAVDVWTMRSMAAASRKSTIEQPAKQIGGHD
ncbi:adenylate/guanylate cyclase domain-containing protein [Roseibium sp. MMSF_3544]|uniref:adenylate/guanylate cyclase domain-containing protein n=1 Tax=unclassified Roseibium TaxID=2629323 RepID=UPI00273E56F7|nr:adenylate/guanylate cyclase domain-containing protein [Roseibium sp. MMSF_3544]